MLLGGLATGLSPFVPTLGRAATAERAFRLNRGGSDVGFHTLTVSEDGARVTMRIAIEIRIRFLGITAYRYEHENVEVWENGRLASLDARTEDDGEQDFVRVRRAGDALRIEGSAYEGEAPSDAAPTSYWYYDAAFASQTWISTQSGKLLEMTFDRAPADGGGERVAVSGGFETTLYYDAAREWRGCAFDGGGVPIEYEVERFGPRFRPLVSA